MTSKVIITVAALIAVTVAQRPYYAGRQPIGYPEIVTTTTTTTSTTPNPNSNDLGNRFGEDQTTSTTTTMRLPIEALGDKELVNRLGKLPLDKQPFWFINWQALEAHRKKPQTYPQKPNTFIDPAVSGFSFQQRV